MAMTWLARHANECLTLQTDLERENGEPATDPKPFGSLPDKCSVVNDAERMTHFSPAVYSRACALCMSHFIPVHDRLDVTSLIRACGRPSPILFDQGMQSKRAQ
jgi:hypothetical protein